METLRFNAFHQVHQGLRALMYHTSLAVQHTNFTDEAQAQETVEKIKEVIYLFDGHAHVEDSMIFPLLNDFAPEVIDEFEKQHEKDHALGEALAKSLSDFEAAKTDAQKIQAGDQIQVALTEFVAFNLSHMNQEETIVMPLLWKKYNDTEIRGRVMEIVASIPPEKNAKYNYWMLKGLAQHEIITWYKAIQATAPSFVFDQFISLAEKSLAPAKFEALQEGLQLKTAEAV